MAALDEKWWTRKSGKYSWEMEIVRPPTGEAAAAFLRESNYPDDRILPHIVVLAHPQCDYTLTFHVDSESEAVRLVANLTGTRIVPVPNDEEI